jgi:hypothetical protein
MEDRLLALMLDYDLFGVDDFADELFARTETAIHLSIIK